MALKYPTTSYEYKYQNVKIQSQIHTNTNSLKYKSNKTNTKTKRSAAGCILVFPYGAQIPNHLMQIQISKCLSLSLWRSNTNTKRENTKSMLIAQPPYTISTTKCRNTKSMLNHFIQIQTTKCRNTKVKHPIQKQTPIGRNTKAKFRSYTPNPQPTKFLLLFSYFKTPCHSSLNN